MLDSDGSSKHDSDSYGAIIRCNHGICLAAAARATPPYSISAYEPQHGKLECQPLLKKV